jgi:zinc/manganese transport system permease protein
VNALSPDILGPALVAGLLILATHVPLGAIGLNRAGIFTGLAVAQAAVLGLVVGETVFAAMGSWAVQGTALVGALGCAMLLNRTDQRFQPVQEVIVVVVYVVAAAATLALLVHSPIGLEQLTGLLIGQILSVSPMQIVVMTVIYAGVMAAWYFRDLFAERFLFHGMLAVALTVSVQAAGVFPVFAMLIIPAVATRRAPARWRLVMAFNIGAAGYLTGLAILAVWSGLTGAVVVGSLAVAGLVGAKLITRMPKTPDFAEMPNVKSLQEEIQARMTKTKVA